MSLFGAPLKDRVILFVWFCGRRQLPTAHLRSEVIDMKRVFTFITVALMTMAIIGAVFADCGCGDKGKGGDSGKGGNGKLKPESIHHLLNRS
jgi:hypothetical protein